MKKHAAKGGNALNYLVSVVLVLIIASVLILIQGSSPISAFTELVRGAIGTNSAIASSIRWSIPVLIATMAATIAHQSGINNLGLDGQIYFGAFSAACVGAFVQLPYPIHIIFCILVGALAGMIYSAIPALLKVLLGVNEMITTLMFNYVAVFMTEFFTMKMMGMNQDSNPDLIATPEIFESARLTRIMPPYQASTGIFIAIAIAALVWLLYRYTRTGYEWKMLGRNPVFSRYGGVKAQKNYMVAFLLSGFVAGICGAVEILGPHLRFRSNFASNLGWDGIMVALIAKNNPLAGSIVAVIWGMIKAGSLAMERMTSVNRILVTLVQALFVLFITVDVKSMVQKRLASKKLREGTIKKEAA